MKTELKFVTVAHVTSESGDHYLMTIEGVHSADAVKAHMDWEEPEYLCVEDIELIEFVGDK